MCTAQKKGYVDILKLREEVLNHHHSTPVPKPDNAYEGKPDDSASAERERGSRIGFVDILDLRKELLTLPHSNTEPRNTEEVEMLETVVNVVLEKQIEVIVSQYSRKMLTFVTIFSFGKAHRCCIMTLTEEVYGTWSVVVLICFTQESHRKARDRRKMGRELPF